jgi:transcription elongation regulator 1
MEASLREREKEVQRTLATHLRDRDKEREQHKHDEAVQHFNALLADLVSGATFKFHAPIKRPCCSDLSNGR